MSGYVEVEFENNYKGNTYYYVVPEHISVNEIEQYAIVEDIFWKPGDGKHPYKIVHVLNKWEKDEILPEDITHIPTKCIVDIVCTKHYEELRLVQEQVKRIDNLMINTFEQLPTTTKMRLLRRIDNSDILVEFDNYLQKHKEV